MPDRPVESNGTRAAPARIPPPQGPEEEPLVPRLVEPVPRVVVKADLLPAVSALSLVSLVGVPLGWLWAQLVPPQQSVLDARGGLTPLLVESYHDFDALGIFLLLGFAAGVLTAAVLWMPRRRRGPVLLVAGTLGSLVAAWLGVRMGASFAAGLYPIPAHPAVGDLIRTAPEIATGWALLAQPLGFALTYGVAASWNGFDDLGRRR
ncbi:DUF2567 domain-containing protein [Saccharopolyspora rosea]|uniref:DUF2567 domain-containing protein n=1 Tax=Saccharopolyspora rosea TaxID=524884 RepID=A0ABW3FTI4_9PSEU|nr:DUF2567 domain-containing protein [Saccharopolyspora rosea]